MAAMASCCNGAGRRVAFFPFPYQGHFTPLLRLAGALHARGFEITVLHTELRAPDPADYPEDYRFVPVPVDVAPELVASEDIARLVIELNTFSRAPFRDRLEALLAEGGVQCAITDVIWYSAQAAARELGVPAMVFMTSSAASFSTFVAYPTLLEKGYLPIKEAHKDDPVDVLPPFLVKDLQRIDTSNLFDFADLLRHTVEGARNSSGLIINTWDAMEAASLDKIRVDMSVPVFTVAPLNKFSPAARTSLYQLQQDRNCLEWLDTQAPDSVIYVSFGSLAATDPNEFLELAWGLAESKRPFLWVVRPSLIRGFESGELRIQMSSRGRIVDWAPQDEVLAHPAVCAFLTHGGWNSIVEAVAEGVPMMTRPFLGDQFGNARFVCDVWRVGVEIEVEAQLERSKIQAAVAKLLDSKEGKEVRERMVDLKAMVEEGIEEGGSSRFALTSLIEMIKSF